MVLACALSYRNCKANLREGSCFAVGRLLRGQNGRAGASGERAAGNSVGIKRKGAQPKNQPRSQCRWCSARCCGTNDFTARGAAASVLLRPWPSSQPERSITVERNPNQPMAEKSQGPAHPHSQPRAKNDPKFAAQFATIAPQNTGKTKLASTVRRFLIGDRLYRERPHFVGSRFGSLLWGSRPTLLEPPRKDPALVGDRRVRLLFCFTPSVASSPLTFATAASRGSLAAASSTSSFFTS